MKTNWVKERLEEGLVIPAHPLALTDEGVFDERHQRALARYYHASGAGGLAVGVHTTQFAIRENGLYEPVLALVAETLVACDAVSGRETVRIAGIVGDTPQATKEATVARKLGYHAGLLSLSALKGVDEARLLEHVRTVAAIIPVFGFYLQPAVGGIALSESFWGAFAEIEQVIAIKVAPFDRYKTLDVLRGVAASGRADDIALYTGNDDTILADLLTTFRIPVSHGVVELDFKGGLLGHWACWTQKAVEHLSLCKTWKQSDTIPAKALALAAEVTDTNAAFFDATNGFKGCIAGIHYALMKQGLLGSVRCLDPDEVLSPGQKEEIDRVMRVYPHLSDHEFVARNLDSWLA